MRITRLATCLHSSSPALYFPNANVSVVAAPQPPPSSKGAPALHELQPYAVLVIECMTALGGGPRGLRAAAPPLVATVTSVESD